jgi:Protein of unknown function (DUF3987)
MSVVHEPVDRLLHALERSGFDPRPAGPACWESRCPAHRGHRRNLSIRRGEDGRALLHCHHTAENGQPTCSAQDILGAIGLEVADLFSQEIHSRPRGPGGGQQARPQPRKHATVEAALAFVESRIVPRPVMTRSWTYDDAAGNPVMAVGRFDLVDESKTYRPFHRLADGSWVMGDPPGLLPLYRLDEVAAATEVIVLEGEKCAEAARQTGWVATTSAHGSASPDRTDWSPLAGKNVVLIPDNDPPGMSYARAVLRLLKRLDPRPRVKLISLPGLAQGDDFVDWSARLSSDPGPDDPIEIIRFELKQLGDAAPTVDLEAVEEPSPPAVPADPADDDDDDSTQTADWPDAPDEAAFHGVAGEIVRVIAPSTEADPLALLLQLLTGLGNAMGRGVWVEADGQRHHPNEFLCCVGDTSRARKGTSWKRLRPVLAVAEPTWAETRITAGLSSGEGLVWEVRDPISAPSPKNRAQVVVDHGVDDKRVLIVESELGNVLRVLAREGNTLSAILRMAWDGDDLRTMTKNTPARATNPHVSLIGHITQQELARYFSAVEVFNGLGNRVLWACVRRSNVLPFGGTCDSAWLDRLAARLALAVQQARELGPLEWSQSGRKTWEDAYTSITADRPGLWGAITSRAEAHVLRLALIFTLLDRGAAIEDDHLHAALALWGYCDRSAAHLFNGSLGSRDADMILSALRARPLGMTRTEINVEVFRRNRTSGTINRALALLLKYHLARHEPASDGFSRVWLATSHGVQATN